MKKLPVIMGIAFIAVIVTIATLSLNRESPAFAAAGAGKSKTYDYHSVNTADASGAGVTVWATGANEKFSIHSLLINGPVAMQVQLLDGAAEIATIYYAADGGACPILDLKSVAKGNDLKIVASGAGQLSITVVGDSIW